MHRFVIVGLVLCLLMGGACAETYNQIARNTGAYLNQEVTITGTVIQSTYDADYDVAVYVVIEDIDTMNVFICGHSSPVERALEGDNVRITGIFTGLFSYESPQGLALTKPSISVSRIEYL